MLLFRDADTTVKFRLRPDTTVDVLVNMLPAVGINL